MTNKTLNKIILSATTAMFLTACGSSGGSTPTAAETASAKIQAYAVDGTKPAPTVADYAAVGITVTEADLTAMNALVDDKTNATDVDDKAELEALLASLTADTTAPVITLTGGVSSVTVGNADTPPTVTANDDTDGDITSSIVTTGTVNTDTAGTYTVTYNVADAAGNDATEVVRTVTVTAAVVADTEVPVITLLGNSSVDILINTPYIDAGATANDDKDGDITANIVTTSTVDTNTSNTYTVKYNVADAAGKDAVEATRTVTVHATQFVAANGEVKDIVRDLTWKNTVDANTTCTGDFHTPTVEQFQTIIDYSKDYTTSVALLVDGFDATLTGHAQTSNGDVDIARGSVHHTNDATNTICVKGTWAPAADNFTRDDGNNTVKDNNTELVWQDNSIDWVGDLKTYADAMTACSGDWRLPTLVELDGIYNRTENNISSGFNNVAPAIYWSTTPIIGEANATQWTVNFRDVASELSSGQIYGKPSSTTAYFRCVK